jgi:ABC-type Fe3+-hydroxamate transport system substrate-binding protein
MAVGHSTDIGSLHIYKRMMRKNILIILALIMLSACGGRQPQAEKADAAVADSTEVTAPKETDSTVSHPQSYNLTGTIGEEKASMVLDKNGNNVTGVVTRCDYCVPINVKGTWQDGKITVDGVSQAGSHIDYQLTVTGNAVQGVEILSAEGVVEKQNVTMTIENK